MERPKVEMPPPLWGLTSVGTQLLAFVSYTPDLLFPTQVGMAVKLSVGKSRLTSEVFAKMFDLSPSIV